MPSLLRARARGWGAYVQWRSEPQQLISHEP